MVVKFLQTCLTWGADHPSCLSFLLKLFFKFHSAIDHTQYIVGLAVVSLFAKTISAMIGITTLVLTGLGGPDNLGAI